LFIFPLFENDTAGAHAAAAACQIGSSIVMLSAPAALLLACWSACTRDRSLVFVVIVSLLYFFWLFRKPQVDHARPS
jgi:hypothetical protein